MKRMIGDNDNDNNIKYIHKPTIVKDNDPLILIGKKLWLLLLLTWIISIQLF